MPPQRRTGRPTLKQAESIDKSILDGARKAFCDHGAAATMDHIASFIGVTKLTIYRRFATKEDLLLAVIDEDVAHVASVAESTADPDRTAIENLHAVARGMFDMIVTPEAISISRIFLREFREGGPMHERAVRWRNAMQSSILPHVEQAQHEGAIGQGDAVLFSDILFEILSAQSSRLSLEIERPTDDALSQIFEDRWAFFLKGASKLRLL